MEPQEPQGLSKLLSHALTVTCRQDLVGQFGLGDLDDFGGWGERKSYKSLEPCASIAQGWVCSELLKIEDNTHLADQQGALKESCRTLDPAVSL